MFLTIAGVAGPPESLTMLILNWGAMLVGPSALIIGSILSLRRIPTRRGPILVIVGCLIFTCFALYNTLSGIQRQPLQAPAPYSFLVVLLFVMVLSDIAAYKIFRGYFLENKDIE
jgi:hypothetical protein